MAAQDYMGMKREVDPQLDLRNVLNAIAGGLVRPQTSYAGLTAEQVNNNANNAAGALARQAQMMQGAQEGAVRQEQQQFQDAMAAQQMDFQAQQLALQRAAQALQASIHAASSQRENQRLAMEREIQALKLAGLKGDLDLAERMKNTMVDVDGNKVSADIARHLPRAMFGANPTTFDKKQSMFMQEAAPFKENPALFNQISSEGMAQFYKARSAAMKSLMAANRRFGKMEPQEQLLLIDDFMGLPRGSNAQLDSIARGSSSGPRKPLTDDQARQASELF